MWAKFLDLRVSMKLNLALMQMSCNWRSTEGKRRHDDENHSKYEFENLVFPEQKNELNKYGFLIEMTAQKWQQLKPISLVGWSEELPGAHFHHSLWPCPVPLPPLLPSQFYIQIHFTFTCYFHFYFHLSIWPWPVPEHNYHLYFLFNFPFIFTFTFTCDFHFHFH